MIIMGKNRNAGMSLVELLVVVAIMGVLIGVATVSFNVVKKSNVTKAASTIDDYLSVCRQKAKTISANEWNVTIEDGKISVYKVVSDEEFVTVQTTTLPSNVKIYLEDEDGNPTYISDEDVDAVTIVFKPLSGEVKSVYFTDGGAKLGEIDLTSQSFCDIISAYKTDKQKTVRLYFTTGKHTVVD